MALATRLAALPSTSMVRTLDLKATAVPDRTVELALAIGIAPSAMKEYLPFEKSCTAAALMVAVVLAPAARVMKLSSGRSVVMMRVRMPLNLRLAARISLVQDSE